jgi:hypothetical protein
MEAWPSGTKFPSVPQSPGVDFAARSKSPIILFWRRPGFLLLLPRSSMVSLYGSVLWVSGAGVFAMETHPKMN